MIEKKEVNRTKAPGIPQNPTRASIGLSGFNCTKEQLLAAVRAVGKNAANVERYLKGSAVDQESPVKPGLLLPLSNFPTWEVGDARPE